MYMTVPTPARARKPSVVTRRISEPQPMCTGDEEEEEEDCGGDEESDTENCSEPEEVYAIYLSEAIDERTPVPAIRRPKEQIGRASDEESRASEEENWRSEERSRRSDEKRDTKAVVAYIGDRTKVVSVYEFGLASACTLQSSEFDGWYLWDPG